MITQNYQLKKNPFIEILIREFATSLFESLKRLTPKRYVREEENLNYLKGKIKFSENIRYNCTNQAKFYCEYDEFSENNLLNQLFLFVSTCLYNISNNSYNKKTLKFIINYYSDISFVRFDKFKVSKIKLTRNQELFKKTFKLAKMFVEQTSVDLSKNKFENITLVWDMNKLFEEFVYEILKRQTSLSVSAQKGKRLLKNVDSKIRNTYVDILITKPQKIVVDTKYKELQSIQDFDNKDAFQVITYCLLHNTNKAVLIYPKFNNNINKNYELNIDKKVCPFFIENNPCNKEKIDYKYTIKFLTINLKYKLNNRNVKRIAKIIEGRILQS